MPSHCCRKLAVRHLAGRFQFNDEPAEFLALQTLVEFDFGFTRTEDQECF